jgi:hypothetical protein
VDHFFFTTNRVFLLQDFDGGCIPFLKPEQDGTLADEKKDIDDVEAHSSLLEVVEPLRREEEPLEDLEKTTQKQLTKETQTKNSLLKDPEPNVEEEQHEESGEADSFLLEVTGPLFALKQHEAEVEVDSSLIEAFEPLLQEKKVVKQVKCSLLEAKEPLAIEKTDKNNFSEGDNKSDVENSELLVSSFDSSEMGHKIGSVGSTKQSQEHNLLSISSGNSCCQKPTSEKISQFLLPKFQPLPVDDSTVDIFEKHSCVASEQQFLTLLEADSYFSPGESDKSTQQLMLSTICNKCPAAAALLQSDQDLQSRHFGSECKTQKRHSWLWSSPEVRKRKARHDAVERKACDIVTDLDASKLSFEERRPMISKSNIAAQSITNKQRVAEELENIQGMIFIRPSLSEQDALCKERQNVPEPVSATQLSSANAEESVSSTQVSSANAEEPVSSTQLSSTNSAESAIQLSPTHSAEPVSATELSSTTSAVPVSATQLSSTTSAAPVNANQLFSTNSGECVSSMSTRSLSRRVSFRTPQVAGHKLFV